MGSILSLDDKEKQDKIQNKKIKFIPVWKWLLEN